MALPTVRTLELPRWLFMFRFACQFRYTPLSWGLGGCHVLESSAGRIPRGYLFSTSASATQASGGPPNKRLGDAAPPYPGPLGPIRRSIHESKVKKWGLLIYRCDYGSDEAWAEFMATVKWHIEDPIKLYQAEDLLPSLEITIKEDRGKLNGASVDRVRDVFMDWVGGNEAKEELRDAPYPGFCASFRYPRYTYCVHADADVIDSVVRRAPRPPLWDYDSIGYVNLISLDARKVMDGGEAPVTVEEPTEGDEEEVDDDDGDEHFVRVPLHYLAPESYAELSNPIRFNEWRRFRRGDGVSTALF